MSSTPDRYTPDDMGTTKVVATTHNRRNPSLNARVPVSVTDKLGAEAGDYLRFIERGSEIVVELAEGTNE